MYMCSTTPFIHDESPAHEVGYARPKGGLEVQTNTLCEYHPLVIALVLHESRSLRRLRLVGGVHPLSMIFTNRTAILAPIYLIILTYHSPPPSHSPNSHSAPISRRPSHSRSSLPSSLPPIPYLTFPPLYAFGSLC